MKKLVSIVAVALMFAGLFAFKDGAGGHVVTENIDTNKWPKSFGLGRTATVAEIKAWDIDIRPDGKGLPAGQGTAAAGKLLYQQKCLACHAEATGANPGVKSLGPVLISDTLLTGRLKTIGNYWPYATTLFDYIRRAMPYAQPGSLTDTEVYSITAYLLNANKILKDDVVLNAKNLPKIVMPAKKLFIMDNRKGGHEVK
ncbi:MAG: cytochrome c [Bacteroidota bacterium]